MFHIIYILAVMFVIPCICWIIDSVRQKGMSVAVFCKWFVFWAIGVRALTTGAMQFLNSAYTAQLLQVGEESYVIISELGFAQFAIGLIGIMSLFKKSYRPSAVISYSVFMIRACFIHISRFQTAGFDEIVSLIGDIWVVIIAVIFFVNQRKVSD